MLVPVSASNSHHKHQSSWVRRECAICGSRAIGMNFGASTCAPCKAFFRRNARRKEVLQLSCQSRLAEALIADRSKYCSQIRHCTSCRLRRCFDAGMKEELVRTDEEKQRYRDLVESNRQRRKELFRLQQEDHGHSHIARPIVSKVAILHDTDWVLLSNIVNAYDNYCLKHYTEQRRILFEQEIDSSKQSLPSSDRVYLCKHNIRPLGFPNIHELEQICFSEPWQIHSDNVATEFVCGKTLFLDYVRIKSQARSILVADAVVTRLWLLVLFFSAPLYCYFDLSLPKLTSPRQLSLNQLQNSYALLLWNYLCHRHGHDESVRIFSNLVRVYLQMQPMAQAANAELRTRADLATLNQALNRASIYERDVQQ